MDVDLLRPGTVPISPDTILWFEFLLNEELLLKHLQRPSPDPSPLDLISKFTSVVFESTTSETKRIDLENGEFREIVVEDQKKFTLKHMALKILCLKVAAYLKWNLDLLKALPFRFQLSLFQDLMYFTNDETPVEIANISKYEKDATQALRFALILYHRWIVKVAVTYGFQPKQMNMEFSSPDESVVHSSENIQQSIDFLIASLNWEENPGLLTFDCFHMLTEVNAVVRNDWSHSIELAKNEFCTQIAYDLAVFYFFKEEYKAATSYFINCKQYYKNATHSSGFLSIDLDELDGYLLACKKTYTDDNLLQQMQVSIGNQFMGIMHILLQDNEQRQIPVINRINLELDIRSALSSGSFVGARDFLPKIQALNAVRCIMDNIVTYQYELTLGNVDIFIWAVTPMIQARDEEFMQSFIIQTILKTNNPLDMFNKLRFLLPQKVAENFMQYLQKNIKEPQPVILHQKDRFDRNQHLEVRSLEQQIIRCYDHQEIRRLLTKLTSKSTSRKAREFNPCWEVPIPLQCVLVLSIPNGFLQNLSFILLAKSHELMLDKNWQLSFEFLQILEKEIEQGMGNAIPKLSRLISWETLLIKINQLLEEWPASNIDKQELIRECEACLQSGESVLPRTEIIEHCELCLLSLGHWDFLVGEDQWNHFKLVGIPSACQELHKFKGSKKLPRELWDLALPIFVTSPTQTKRSNSGNTVIHRDSFLTNNKSKLISTFLKLRGNTVLNVIISMLARLHNVLRDESTLELNVDFIVLWPAVVSNANSYSTKAVLEVLTEVVEKALYYYPTNISWMKLLGDINFVSGFHDESLKWYLKSLLLITDNFNIPVRNEDPIIKRMIKNCIALNCHTQAATLCQFLDEPDYMLAFHSLGEQKLCSDASDAYYHCFRDTSMLEYLINLHHKRAEFQRRRHSVQVMGLLELNSNNNEEIQHEASSLRKSIFLLALCKQYIH